MKQMKIPWTEIQVQRKSKKTPPVFAHGVISYGEMIKRIRDIAEDEQYYTNSLANSVIKVTCGTPETYKDNNIPTKSIQNCH